MRWPRRRRGDHGAEVERLLCEMVAARLLIHACGLRAGAAMIRAEMARDEGDEREQLAWEFQALLAVGDAEAHGERAKAAKDRIESL